MLDQLGNAGGLLVAVLGFGAIVFIHEMGHFLAARWAGIRVYAFAVGFGPAALAWRKGIGVRRGSTNPDTLKRLRDELGETGESTLQLENVENRWPDDIGKTEYRLNWLPFGGYVHMRGQDDIAPGEASTNIAPDSFMAKPVWKRMVVISAGVVMNVILALVLYIAVYSMGKPASPAVVGGVAPGSPAESAVALNAAEAGIGQPGLRVGDTIVEINGKKPREFGDLWMAGALANPDEGVSLRVRRAGVDDELSYSIKAVRTPTADFPSIGVQPAVSTTLAEPDPRQPGSVLNIAFLRREAGLGATAPGGALTRLAGADTTVLPALGPVFAGSADGTVSAVFTDHGTETPVVLRGVPELERVTTKVDKTAVTINHLLGFVPAMRVGPVFAAAEAGLEPGDVFVRIGRVEWPGPAEGIRAIRDAAGEDLELVVLRDNQRVNLTVRVGIDGTIGFQPMQERGRAIVSRPLPAGAEGGRVAETVALVPGSVIETVNGTPISGYAGLREQFAHASPGEPVSLGVLLPVGDGVRINVETSLSAKEIARTRALRWDPPAFFPALFEPARITVKASNPVQAVVMGVSDTNQMILRTYLTLIRLFEGAVEVDQLRGPVGIAHIGTKVAQQSLAELLFFFAVISANLAVLNFLPVPIADGGLMVFLLIEWITGKPVSPRVQNGAALAGIAMLGSLFLIVTFNDISRLL